VVSYIVSACRFEFVRSQPTEATRYTSEKLIYSRDTTNESFIGGIMNDFAGQ
jgi:hypothetical protein